MNLFFLFIYFLIILAVIEIHVILFQLTGLKVEISRFQVISMMTGTGFTTGESELILGHPIRRKLAIFLILFGAFSLAVIISSISNFLSGEINRKGILAIAGTILLTFFVLKLNWTKRLLSKLFKQEMKQNVELADLPIRDIFLTNKEDDVLKLNIYENSLTCSNTLKHVMNLDIVVIFIKRGDQMIRNDVYSTKIQAGDQLFLFGNKQVILHEFHHDIQLMEEQLAQLNSLA